MTLSGDAENALNRAADAVRIAASSIRQVEERLRFESEDDEDLLGYLEPIEGARKSVEGLSDQLDSYMKLRVSR